MQEDLLLLNPTSMSDSAAEHTEKRRWEISDIVEHLRKLCSKESSIRSLLLELAVKKGQLLQSLKEQTTHGDWTKCLKELALHERYAQRLISLPKWSEKLIAENQRRAPECLSVTQAFKLVADWNKLSTGYNTAKVKGRNKKETAFRLKHDTKCTVLTWAIEHTKKEQIIHDLETNGQVLIDQILRELKNL